ncbi:hypothetical protein HJC23_008092 [Cyclotella cryptica]|uniref:Sulfotransferase n=1 Tax=Cyclotella cryptica TaxID=29204 RepID=A0ABD3PFF2_9STRA|eukprot:CCRYP_014994-RA/>CCRYP_014994-RA protein AED:0.36 eAED:0.36 QI:0/-1/0/1/-1/1/1/0/301
MDNLFVKILLVLCYGVSRQACAEIQIIGTGTGRTGSTTLQNALNILGYKTYHMKDILTGGKDRIPELDFWFHAFETNSCHDTDELRNIFERGGYNATVHAINFPCHEALLFQMYPNAKVIHTQRTNSEVWHDSVTNSICKLSSSGFLQIMGIISPVFRRFKRFTPLLMGRAIVGLDGRAENVNKQYCLDHKEQMIKFYNSHNARIKAIVPPERLLVLSNHEHGWEPICNFLGVPIPSVPFPHVNKRGSTLNRIYFLVSSILANQADSSLGIIAVVICLLIVLALIRNWERRRVMRRKSKSN